jgi:hypothetical protein
MQNCIKTFLTNNDLVVDKQFLFYLDYRINNGLSDMDEKSILKSYAQYVKVLEERRPRRQSK